MKTKKILIVEDDKMLGHLFEMFIRDLGYELVGMAHNSHEAIAKCSSNKPDVILMDIHIQGALDGIETAKQIYKEFDIPVVYVSSDTEEVTVKNAIFTNTYGFLVKPIYKNTLGIIVELAYYKHQYDKEFKINERRNCAQIDVSQDAILVISKNLIEYANCKAMIMLNVTEVENLLGKNISEYIDPEYLASFEQAMQNIEQTPQNAQTVSCLLRTFDHETYKVEVLMEALEFSNKNAIQLTFTS